MYIVLDAMFTEPTTIDIVTQDGLMISMATVHFNLVCPPEGLTINACGRQGVTILYISTLSNPSSAQHEEILILNGHCRNTFISCSNGNDRRKRQIERIYIAIEGVEEANIYDLQARTGDHSTPQGIYIHTHHVAMYIMIMP